MSQYKTLQKSDAARLFPVSKNYFSVLDYEDDLEPPPSQDNVARFCTNSFLFPMKIISLKTKGHQEI
jgi:hypothetical protein